jgi:hypothetical protein
MYHFLVQTLLYVDCSCQNWAPSRGPIVYNVCIAPNYNTYNTDGSRFRFDFFSYVPTCNTICRIARVTRWVSEKLAQNTVQPIFCQTHKLTFSVEKSSPKIWALSVFFNNAPVNYHPIGENSPNLVTLRITYLAVTEFFSGFYWGDFFRHELAPEDDLRSLEVDAQPSFTPKTFNSLEDRRDELSIFTPRCHLPPPWGKNRLCNLLTDILSCT